MCALAIRDDIGPQELRRRARQESDGRVAARLIAIANALAGDEERSLGVLSWRWDCKQRPHRFTT
jgi:hypothetical protein